MRPQLATFFWKKHADYAGLGAVKHGLALRARTESKPNGPNSAVARNCVLTVPTPEGQHVPFISEWKFSESGSYQSNMGVWRIDLPERGILACVDVSGYKSIAIEANPRVEIALLSNAKGGDDLVIEVYNRRYMLGFYPASIGPTLFQAFENVDLKKGVTVEYPMPLDQSGATSLNIHCD